MVCLLGHVWSDVLFLAHHLAQLGGGDINEGYVNNRDILVLMCPVGYVALVAWVDGYLVIVKDILTVCPLMKLLEIVSSNDENELIGGVVALKVLQGVPSIGWSLEPKFVVGSYEVWITLKGCANYLQTDVLVDKFCRVAFERILGRDEVPHFV